MDTTAVNALRTIRTIDPSGEVITARVEKLARDLQEMYSELEYYREMADNAKFDAIREGDNEGYTECAQLSDAAHTLILALQNTRANREITYATGN